MELRRAAVLAFDALLVLLILYYSLFSSGGRSQPVTTIGMPEGEDAATSGLAQSRELEGADGTGNSYEDTAGATESGQPVGRRRGGKRAGGLWRRSEAEGKTADPVGWSVGRSSRTYTNTGGETCGASLADYSCPASPRKAVVTLSTGKRPHFAVTGITLATFARRVGADLHVVDTLGHRALAGFNASAQAGRSSHFIKLPMLKHFLAEYDQVLFVDDDVLLSPLMLDVFSQVDCRKVGAVVEASHVQGWHTMHAKAFCEIYDLKRDRRVWKQTCASQAVKRQRIFNSGVLLLSKAHRPLIDEWEREPLRCKILCDQLYMNAMLRRHAVCLDDLGTAFNLPGTQMRKMLTSTAAQREEGTHLQLRDSAIADACVAHLTVLPSKSVSAAYLLKRSLTARDVLQCAGKGGPVDKAALLGAMQPEDASPSEDEVERLWCSKIKGEGCKLIRMHGGGAEQTEGAGEAAAGADGEGGGGGVAAGSADASGAQFVPAGPSEELPEQELGVIRRAAEAAWDSKTVILLFATGDFVDLAINWAQATRALGLRNFVLVAMDRKLGDILGRFTNAPGLLLPRVASGTTTITKLSVIGERQRFGLRVLEAGFHVLFVDLDALFLRSPEPLLRDGDIIGERIWGRPRNVVQKWGAAICTGFYFLRATAANVAIFRKTHHLIAEKRQRQPKWQASDQWAINNALDQQVVEWVSGTSMKPISDFSTKFYDNSSHVGYTKLTRTKFVVLPHVAVARSCPILKFGAAKPPAAEKVETRKWKLWQHLLQTSHVLHCFPPDSMPCPELKHGEKGCDKSVIMGSAVHIHGEVVFDRRQGLWFMKEGWEQAIAAPSTQDFWAWLEGQYNGLKPGEAPPEKA